MTTKDVKPHYSQQFAKKLLLANQDYKKLEHQALQVEDVAKKLYQMTQAQSNMLEELASMANAGAWCVVWDMPLLSADTCAELARTRPDGYRTELDAAEDAYWKARETK